jgi:hypothetical protein
MFVEDIKCFGVLPKYNTKYIFVWRRTIMCRKLIFLTSFLLVMGLAFANVASAYVIEVGIATDDDDAEQHLIENPRMDIGSSDLEIPYEDGGFPATDIQAVGVRYELDIPKGSTIISASLVLQADKADKDGTLEPVNVIIRGELSPNAAQFGSDTTNITDRPTTEAFVAWSIPPYTEIGQREQTPDLTAIIQEVVDQDGWTAGNGLVLIIVDDPDNPSTGLRESEAGPGDDSATLTVEFTTPISFAPVPADGDIEVETTTLEWMPGSDAIVHRVYLGTDPALDDPNAMIAETDVALVATALEPGTTYYWRVDDVVDAIEDVNDANDVEVVNTGDVWSFTTLALEAHFPSPYNGAKWIPLDAQLSWTAGKDAIMHDVYMDVNEALVAASDPNVYMGKLMDTSFDPGALEPGTTYYWKVDEFAIGVTNPGPVWSFTATDPDVGGVETEFYLGMTLAGKPVVVRTDKAIDFNWGEEAPDPNVPADNFSVRFNADLQVAVDGTYMLHGTADDGIRVYLDNELLIDAWVDQGMTEYDTPPLDLVAGETYLVTLEQYENGGGAGAELRWSSDVISKQIIPSGALMPPTVATSPMPANGAENVSSMTMLSWNPSDAAVQHDVYISTDPDALGAAVTVDDAALDPGILDLGTTYYWRVDEVDADGAVVEGLVNSFTVSNNVIVDDIEAYNDLDNLVFEAWMAAGGAIVGNAEAPYVNITNVNGGLQAMLLTYDNTPMMSEDPNAEPSTVSEATLTLDPAQYWGSGVGGATALEIAFRGRTPDLDPGSTSYDEETGVITMVGRGADIWGSSDQFQYAYLPLSGDGSMTVRLEDLAETDNWSKAGIMVRETLDAGSKHASVYVTTPANGIRFQARPETDADSTADDAVATDEAKAQTEPVWLRLERTGDEFNAYYALPLPEPEPVDPNDPNAVEVDPNAPEPELEWIAMGWNPQVLPMDPNVLIGLALTSHSGDATYATATFSGLEFDGGVGGLPLTSQEIGLTLTQSPATLYAAIEDSAGGISIAKHPDPQALVSDEWANWTIDLSEFDIDMADVAKLTIGVEPANCDDPMVCSVYPNGMGELDIDDIQLIPDVDMFDGTLDGWDHDNSVDKWDGSAPGEGNPGGLAALVEDDVTYLRLQDTGDPRDYGDTTPTGKTNESLYLTQPTDFALDGAIIEFRARIATTGTLDAWRKDGGGMASTGLFDWPAGGLGGSFDNGTHVDYGRGNIGIAEKGVGVVSFVLTTSGLKVGNDGNKISVDDATQWNTYTIEIDAGGSGTHVLKASANGGDVKTFNITAGTGTVENGTYIAIGSPDLAGRVATAFDVDYIKVSWK